MVVHEGVTGQRRPSLGPSVRLRERCLDIILSSERSVIVSLYVLPNTGRGNGGRSSGSLSQNNRNSDRDVASPSEEVRGGGERWGTPAARGLMGGSRSFASVIPRATSKTGTSAVVDKPHPSQISFRTSRMRQVSGKVLSSISSPIRAHDSRKVLRRLIESAIGTYTESTSITEAQLAERRRSKIASCSRNKRAPRIIAC